MTTESKKNSPTYAAAVANVINQPITDHFKLVQAKGSNRKDKTRAKLAKGKSAPAPITPHANANANLFESLSDEDDDDGAINLTNDATDSDTDEETTTPSKKEAEAFARREACRKARKQLRKERKAKKAGKGRKKTKDTLLDEEEKAATTDDYDLMFYNCPFPPLAGVLPLRLLPLVGTGRKWSMMDSLPTAAA